MPLTGQLGTVNSQPSNIALAVVGRTPPPVIPVVAFTARLGTPLSMLSYIEMGVSGPVPAESAFGRIIDVWGFDATDIAVKGDGG